MPLYANDPTGQLAYFSGNWLTSGEEVIYRPYATSSAQSAATGVLKLSYWTARKTENSTQGRVTTGGTAAAATPTLCRFGVYSIAANGDGTLVASVVNDTTLFAATFSVYTRNWSSTFPKVRGQRYAFGILVVTGAATPTFLGIAPGNAVDAFTAPSYCANLTGQTDLPGSFTAGSLAASSQNIQGYVLP